MPVTNVLVDLLCSSTGSPVLNFRALAYDIRSVLPGNSFSAQMINFIVFKVLFSGIYGPARIVLGWF